MTAFIRLCRIRGRMVSSFGDNVEVHCRWCLFLQGISGGCSRNSAMGKENGKKITQITENRESPKSKRGCLLGNSHVGVKPKQKMTNYS